MSLPAALAMSAYAVKQTGGLLAIVALGLSMLEVAGLVLLFTGVLTGQFQ